MTLRSATRVLTIGLTGGIASGKTLVSDRLAALGASVIDTDVVAREVVAPGSEGLARIIEHFGKQYLTETGELDRRKLRSLVFRDDQKRRSLEAITHPLIRQRCQQLAAKASGDYLVFVVPLLLGSSFEHSVDRILVVDCSPEMQLDRLQRRDGEDFAGAQRIVAAQTDRESRLAIADDVLANRSGKQQLLEQTDRLHAFYLQLANRLSPKGNETPFARQTS